jgi:hypothetical protein
MAQIKQMAVFCEGHLQFGLFGLIAFCYECVINCVEVFLYIFLLECFSVIISCMIS